MVRIKYNQLFLVVTVIGSLWYAKHPVSAQTLDLSGLDQSPLQSITSTVNSVTAPSTPQKASQSPVSGVTSIVNQVQQTAGQTLTNTEQVVNQTVQTASNTVTTVSQTVTNTLGNIEQIGQTGQTKNDPTTSKGSSTTSDTPLANGDTSQTKQSKLNQPDGSQPTTSQLNENTLTTQTSLTPAISTTTPVATAFPSNQIIVPQTVYSMVTKPSTNQTIQPSKFIPFPENKAWLYAKFGVLGVLLLIIGWSAYRFVRNLRHRVQNQESIT